MLARLHVAEARAWLSDRGSRVAAEDSANRSSKVFRISASLRSTAGAEKASMGLRAASTAREDRRYMMMCGCLDCVQETGGRGAARPNV
jgi:hypothetical protein